MIHYMTDVEIAWCAGLFEGEGSIFIVKQKRRGLIYQYIRASIKMTDLDVLTKFHKLVGIGTIIHQSEANIAKQPSHYKKHYYWQANNRDELGNLMIQFWEHLGERRKKQILETGLVTFTE